MTIRYGLALSAALAAPAAMAAATATTSTTAPAALGTLVVTATRTPQPASDTLAATTVITRADIERSQAQNLGQLLENTPSLSIANSGGPGKQTSIHLRGTDSNQVLVLVDGVRYGSATNGLAAISNFPVSQIRRIEIVRGPRSSLYGADAVGGVIQIFTRDGAHTKGRGPVPYFSATGGSYGTFKSQAGVSGSTRRAHYNVSLSGETTRGFNACTGRPFGAPGGAAGCYANQPDRDGYHRIDGSAHVGYRFANDWRLSAHVLRTDGHVQYDGPTTNRTHTVQTEYGVKLDAPLTARWKTQLSLARDRDASKNYFNKAFQSRFRTTRDELRWQNDLQLTSHQSATLGLDYRLDRVSSSVRYTRDHRDNKGAFAEYQGRFGPNEIDVSGRVDDNQAYGTHATGSVSYGYHVNRTYTLTASYGNAFNAPTFNDLYYPSAPGYPPASNPDLKPEKSRTAEIGVKASPTWGHWSIHAYQTRIDHEIALDANYTPHNLASARIRGVEGQLVAYLGHWRIGANADWLHAENRTPGANHGNDLPRRPDYSASVDVDRDLFGRFSAGATARFAGARYDDLANRRKLSAYAVFDLRGEMRIDPAWKLQAKIENLFDRHYHTAAFYNQPGRAFYLTVRYTPGQT